MTSQELQFYPVKRLGKVVPFTGNVDTLMLLVGGYPKGHIIPFDFKTHSGRILRTMLDRIGRDPVIIDLWNSAEEEKAGIVSEEKRAMIATCLEVEGRVIALGKHVHERLRFYFANEERIEYLPHPASRRKASLEKLEAGLKAYPRWWCVQPDYPDYI